MPYFSCERCKRSVSVRGDVTEIRELILNHPNWAASGPPCIDGCGGTMVQMRLSELEARCYPHGVTPKEFFRALCGFGLPDEIATEPEIVRTLLKNERIVDVKVSRASSRVLLHHIDLENGLRLHLTLCSAGAAVYKITRYLDAEVDNDQGGVHPHPEGDALQRDRGVHGGGEG